METTNKFFEPHQDALNNIFSKIVKMLAVRVLSDDELGVTVDNRYVENPSANCACVLFGPAKYINPVINPQNPTLIILPNNRKVLSIVDMSSVLILLDVYHWAIFPAASEEEMVRKWAQPTKSSIF